MSDATYVHRVNCLNINDVNKYGGGSEGWKVDITKYKVICVGNSLNNAREG